MRILKTDKRLIDEGWRYKVDDDEKTITCSEVNGGGVVGYGILKFVEEEKVKLKTVVVDGVKYKEVI